MEGHIAETNKDYIGFAQTCSLFCMLWDERFQMVYRPVYLLIYNDIHMIHAIHDVTQ